MIGRKGHESFPNAVTTCSLTLIGEEEKSRCIFNAVGISPLSKVSVLTLRPGSRKLKDRFSSSNPAFYGELACVLKSDEYQKLDPQEAQSWREVPTFLDVIKKVINGCVEWVIPPSVQAAELTSNQG